MAPEFEEVVRRLELGRKFRAAPAYWLDQNRGC